MSAKSLIMAILTVLLSLILMVGSAWAGEPIDRTAPASPDGSVEISNVAGSVTILGWDREEIRVTGTLGEGTERLDFEVDDDEAEIEVVLPKHSSSVEGTDLVVHLPRASRLEVETVSASITASELAGSLELATVSGNMVLAGELQQVEAATVSGAITLGGSAREVEIASVSGGVTITSREIEDLEIESVSGTVVLEGELTPRGRYTLESFSGRVELVIAGEPDARFEVETFSGSIQNRLSDTEPCGSLGKQLELTLGEGSARVSVETFSGKVVIRGA